MSEARLAPFSPELVWARGPDAVRFLNDLISQEILDLEPGRVTRSLLLAPAGKLDHVLWVLRGQGEVGLLTDPGRGGDLASTLGRYRIRVDVEIEASGGESWLILGRRDVSAGSWARTEDGLVADVSWPGLPRTLVTGIRPDLEEMSDEDYVAARISAGEPEWGSDLDEATIPHESGLVPDTVDFTKGCFLGQELVARIDSRGGNVPRRLRLLELGAGRADPGTPVSVGGAEVGRVTSSAGGLAIAVIKRGVETGDEVTVDGLSAVVRELRPRWGPGDDRET